MKKAYTYKAFGIRFKSDFEIPELMKEEGEAAVEILLGKAPEKLEDATQKGIRYEARTGEFLLWVDDIAKYYVQNGKSIRVELLKNEADKEVRLFLLGSAFGALFIQRGLLPIHGSTIKFGNSASTFTGLSGVGKSSIAAHFIHQGFQALADDISVVNDRLEVLPGFPSLKIWNDVLQKLNINIETLDLIRPNMKKFQLPISKNYCTEAVPLKNLVVLSTKNTPGFELEELTGIKKFNAVKNNTYRYRFVKGLEKQQDHFQVLNKLLPQIKVYKVSRPQAPLSLDAFGEFLMQKLDLNA